jgi:hypothetical protein
MTAPAPQLPRASNLSASQLRPSLTIDHPLIGTLGRVSRLTPLTRTSACEVVYDAARGRNLARQIDLICAPQLMSAQRSAAEQNGGSGAQLGCLCRRMLAASPCLPGIQVAVSRMIP